MSATDYYARNALAHVEFKAAEVAQVEAALHVTRLH